MFFLHPFHSLLAEVSLEVIYHDDDPWCKASQYEMTGNYGVTPLLSGRTEQNGSSASSRAVGYNRSNFFENLKLQQSRKFRRQQIIAAQAGSGNLMSIPQACYGEPRKSSRYRPWRSMKWMSVEVSTCWTLRPVLLCDTLDVFWLVNSAFDLFLTLNSIFGRNCHVQKVQKGWSWLILSSNHPQLH